MKTNSLTTLLTTYLKNEFNYDDTEDKKRSLKYEELSKIDKYSLECMNYKPHIDFYKCIIENMNYKMLYPKFNFENELHSFISLLKDYGYGDNKDINPSIIKMLDNLTEEDANTFETAHGSMINQEKLINMVIFELGLLPDVFDIIEFEYMGEDCYGNPEIGTSKLKDTLYNFPELKLMKRLQRIFNISNHSVVRVIKEEYQDYSTYSVGGFNNDERIEYHEYFDYLINFLLENKKDKNIEDKINLLNNYLILIEDILIEIEMIELAFHNLSASKEIKFRLNSKRKEQLKRLQEIDEVYVKSDIFTTQDNIRKILIDLSRI